jgi:small-conductance mechanosensitive channel
MRLFACGLALLIFFLAPAGAQPIIAPAASSNSSVSQSEGVDELIRILENDGTRKALIERLRASASPEARQGEAGAGADPANSVIARRMAELTKGFAEGLSDTATSIVNLASQTYSAFSTTGGRDYARITQVAGNIALLAAVLLIGYFVMRKLAAYAQSSISRRVAKRGWAPRLAGNVKALLIDLIAVVVAWASGYAVSLYILAGPTGRMGLDQTLLLNAFLIVELSKVLLRAILQPHTPPLRALPLGDTTAAYWYFWLARIVGVIGYPFMFFAPILAEIVGPPAAQVMRILAMATAVLIGILIVLQNKRPVRDMLARRVRDGRTDIASRSLAFLGSYWHIIANAYLIAILFVWLANPEAALPFVLNATVKSVIAILAGGVIISVISRFIHVGIKLPDDVKRRLPLLEGRLHAFVPRLMQLVRTITLVGVVIALAQAWGLIDFAGWVGSETGQRVSGSVISASIILIAGGAIYIAMSSWVEYRLNPDFGVAPTSREKTLLSLFRNAFTIALAVLVTMLALAQIGIDIAPLLAGAGVLGLAIGFGAQKFVQDIITGIFIQFENVMNEGDVVEVGGKSGVVEKLTIRSVSVRSVDGTLHLIPFSSVDLVSNMMKGFSFHVADIGVAYRENIGEVKQAMRDAFDELMETDAKASIIGTLDMQGVTQLGDSAVVVRGRIRTLPGAQWAVGRLYNETVKDIFDRRGIEIPFPHLTIYMGENKQGEAPPLRVARNGLAPA